MAFFILSVVSCVCCSQVFDSIIETIPVDVIDLFRPLIFLNEIDETVNIKQFLFDSDF